MTQEQAVKGKLVEISYHCLSLAVERLITNGPSLYAPGAVVTVRYENDELVPSFLYPYSEESLRELVQMQKALGLVRFYEGEMKQPLPLAPTLAILVIECSKWGHYRKLSIPCSLRKGQYNMVGPMQINSTEERERYLSLFGVK